MSLHPTPTVSARRAAAELGRDTVDHRRRFFMDAGVWGGDHAGNAHADFGLVCGRDILLCSWLNMSEGGRKPRSDESFPAPIQRILGAHSNRGFIVSKARSRIDLTSDSELYVVIGDLHLQLFKLTRYDNFKFNRNYLSGGSTTIISLEAELDELLDLAEAARAKVVQVGDVFEIWEVQAHLIADHIELARLLRDLRQQSGTRLREPWRRMHEQRKLIPRDDYEYSLSDNRHTNREAAAYGLQGPVTAADVDRVGIRIESQEDIKNAIMAKYPRIFSGNRYGDRMRFIWIQGNHDNMLANTLYEDEGLSYRIAAGSSAPYLEVNGGTTQHRIWIEHGHVNDTYNKNPIFDDDGKGYYQTRRYTLNTVYGEGGYHDGAVARWAGDTFYDMRPPQLSRARTIFNAHSNVRLVMMGHTHSATLFDWDDYDAHRQSSEDSIRPGGASLSPL